MRLSVVGPWVFWLVVALHHAVTCLPMDPVADACSPVCNKESSLEVQCARARGCYDPEIKNNSELYSSCWNNCWQLAGQCFDLCADNFNWILHECYDKCNSLDCIADCFNDEFSILKEQKINETISYFQQNVTVASPTDGGLTNTTTSTATPENTSGIITSGTTQNGDQSVMTTTRSTNPGVHSKVKTANATLFKPVTPSTTYHKIPTPRPSSTIFKTPTPRPSATDFKSPTPRPSGAYLKTPTPRPSATHLKTPTPRPSASVFKTPTPRPSAADLKTPTPKPSAAVFKTLTPLPNATYFKTTTSRPSATIFKTPTSSTKDPAVDTVNIIPSITHRGDKTTTLTPILNQSVSTTDLVHLDNESNVTTLKYGDKKMEVTTTLDPNSKDNVTVGTAAIVPDNYVQQVAGVKYMPMMSAESEVKAVSGLEKTIGNSDTEVTALQDASTKPEVLPGQKAVIKTLNFDDVRNLFLANNAELRRKLDHAWDRRAWERILVEYIFKK